MNAPQQQTLTSNSPTVGDQWEVDHIRLSLFFQGAAVDEMAKVTWQSLVGEMPTDIQNRPREKMITEQGKWKDGLLIFTKQLDRADLVYTGVVEQLPTGQVKESLIGKLAPAANEVLALAQNCVPKDAPVVRAAIGSSLRWSVNSTDEGYQLLNQLIPELELEAGKMRDVLYQINKPRTSSLNPSFEINRLTTWSVKVARQGLVQMTAGLPPKSFTSPTGTFAHLELDMNTVQEKTQLPSSDLFEVLRELADLGIEISRSGNIA